MLTTNPAGSRTTEQDQPVDDPTYIQILELVAKRAARENAVLKGLAAIRHRPVSEIEPKFNAAIAAMRAGGLIECAGRRGEKEVRITALGQEWLKAAMRRDRDEE